MALKITETTMIATTHGKVVATANRVGNTWHATTWPHPLDRNAATTALSSAERLITHGEDDPCVMGWRRELARG